MVYKNKDDTYLHITLRYFCSTLSTFYRFVVTLAGVVLEVCLSKCAPASKCFISAFQRAKGTVVYVIL